MRKSRRSRGEQDYIEENEILDETEEFEEEYDEAYDDEELYDDEDAKAGIGKKIAVVVVVIIALVALFFASTKLTEILLDRNQEPQNYETEVPDMEELFEEEEAFPSSSPEVLESATPTAEIDDEDEDEPVRRPSKTEKPSASASASAKPSSSAKPSDTSKPSASATEAPKTEAPKTEAPKTEAPKTEAPSKPIIIPGNPAN